MAYQHKHIIPLKQKNRELLLAYLSNPDNEYPSRSRMGIDILGYKRGESLYNHFTPAELSLIEAEALQLRRSMYAPKLSKVDAGILAEGAKGNAPAAKLAYQRFEGWSEKKTVEGVITFEHVLKQIAGGGVPAIDVTPKALPDDDTQGK